jgi:hypothetical protein
LIAVGGGSFLVPADLKGVSAVIAVPHYDVANAVGAAIAQIGGEVDEIFCDLSRAAAIDRATERARARSVESGADPATIEIVEVEDLPLAYMPGNALRVRVRAVGNLA